MFGIRVGACVSVCNLGVLENQAGVKRNDPNRDGPNRDGPSQCSSTSFQNKSWEQARFAESLLGSIHGVTVTGPKHGLQQSRDRPNHVFCKTEFNSPPHRIRYRRTTMKDLDSGWAMASVAGKQNQTGKP